jgi:hypothetical protein
LFEEVEKAPTRASINRDDATIEALVIIAFIQDLLDVRSSGATHALDSPGVSSTKPAPKGASLDRAMP